MRKLENREENMINGGESMSIEYAKMKYGNRVWSGNGKQENM